MNRSSQFGIKIDFEKSKGSYIYDKVTQRPYLDFFGMYATLTLGYNHPIFLSDEFQDELRRVSYVKITNCEILADESAEFDKKFREYSSKGIFSHFHYCCTGALAIEAAIKTAIDYKGIKNPRIISFKGSFHGINSYGGIVTHRFHPVNRRLDGFPGNYWEPFDNPVITYHKNKPIINENKVKQVLNQIEQTIINNKNVVCILVEPIQCTYGDAYFPHSFFDGLKTLADYNDIPLIFDEIQVGFGGTGKLWYFDHLEIEPDIVAFGKKTQLSGIMVNEKFAKIFETSIRLEVTWDGDIIDMVRCKYIIKAYQDDDILENVKKMGIMLKDGLAKLGNLKNLRHCGLLFAFDFESKDKRDAFVKSVYNDRMICNPTRDLSIRLRPPLSVNEQEIAHAIDIITKGNNSL